MTQHNYRQFQDYLTLVEKKHGGQAWFIQKEGLDLGFLPGFILDSDPRPVREQINERYQHGGGWDPFTGFRLNPRGWLTYPGDPPMRPLAMSRLRDEILVFYECSWLLVIQPSGEWEVSRVD